MNDVDNKYAEKEKPIIIVCDLGMFDWVELADGIVLVDYRYIGELQRKYEG
jgi:hypothetical protein